VGFQRLALGEPLSNLVKLVRKGAILEIKPA
jgi:hypothetical protein